MSDNSETTPPMSKESSPYLRPSSPSPSITPSLALGACPLLDRSVSTPSSVSTFSSRSVSAASDSSINNANRRRGYMRPQGTAFATSARNRDSVMSLGSIAHMQYYFARTGLLDGKGGQLAKQRNTGGGDDVAIMDQENMSPQSEDEAFFREWSDDGDTMMLPPTVSTYKEKPIYIEPLASISVLRRQLRESLDDTRKVLDESKAQKDGNDATSTQPGCRTEDPPFEALPQQEQTQAQGWYEIQGMHILDLVTLAIRAAKEYYTCHNNPQKLYTIKSEREIRAELYQVMDTLKRMANREFRGGMREPEYQSISHWTENIKQMLLQEEALEEEERALLEKWSWTRGDWTGKEREREWLFLSSFNMEGQVLPEWTESLPGSPSPFLRSLQSGIHLIHLHNALVKRSKRRFGEIKTYHTDLNKPYRCADNLRYWLKAAELRWEIKLSLNVLDLVYEKHDNIWQSFDQALLRWSAAVRQELTNELLASHDGSSTSIPQLYVEVEGL